MALFCAGCGNSITADDKFCRLCGRAASAGSSRTLPLSAAAPLANTETSGKAIVSLICGLLFFIPFVFVAAIVFGHLALSEIRKSAGRLKGEGIAIAVMVVGGLESQGSGRRAPKTRPNSNYVPIGRAKISQRCGAKERIYMHSSMSKL